MKAADRGDAAGEGARERTLSPSAPWPPLGVSTGVRWTCRVDPAGQDHLCRSRRRRARRRRRQVRPISVITPPRMRRSPCSRPVLGDVSRLRRSSSAGCWHGRCGGQPEGDRREPQDTPPRPGSCAPSITSTFGRPFEETDREPLPAGAIRAAAALILHHQATFSVSFVIDRGSLSTWSRSTTSLLAAAPLLDEQDGGGQPSARVPARRVAGLDAATTDATDPSVCVRRPPTMRVTTSSRARFALRVHGTSPAGRPPQTVRLGSRVGPASRGVHDRDLSSALGHVPPQAVVRVGASKPAGSLRRARRPCASSASPGSVATSEYGLVATNA
jgi:hypothetical protein